MPGDCLSCHRPLQTPKRPETVRHLAQRLAPIRRFPVVFSLIDRLPLCCGCLLALPLIEGNICDGCGRRMDGSPNGRRRCPDCRQVATDVLNRNRSLLLYDTWSKAMMARFKYRGDERLAALFAGMLAIAYYRHYHAVSFHAATFVPLHDERLRERGFNQAELLAVRTGRLLRLPVTPLLSRVKQTGKLSQHSGRAARQATMSQAFAPLPEACARVRSPRLPVSILLMDDIFTTGSTLRAAAEALRQIPSLADSEICGLTLCR